MQNIRFKLLIDLPGIPAGTISQTPTDKGAAFSLNGNHAFFTFEQLKNKTQFKELIPAQQVFTIYDLRKAMRYQTVNKHVTPSDLIPRFLTEFYPQHLDQLDCLD